MVLRRSPYYAVGTTCIRAVRSRVLGSWVLRMAWDDPRGRNGVTEVTAHRTEGVRVGVTRESHGSHTVVISDRSISRSRNLLACDLEVRDLEVVMVKRWSMKSQGTSILCHGLVKSCTGSTQLGKVRSRG